MPAKSPDLKYVVQIALENSLSSREVARVLKMSPTTIGKYRQLMDLNKITKANLETFTPSQLEEILQAKYRGQSKSFIEPDWQHVSNAYNEPDATISELYFDYAEQHATDSNNKLMSVTTFGRRLSAYRKKQKVSMRQAYRPGEALFVDFSGKHLFITDIQSGKKTKVEIFVSSLCVSQMIFATAVKSQTMPDWIEANTRALEYYGGSSERVVPDNLKSAVIKPRHGSEDAILNRAYKSFGDHYGILIMPARSGRPQDKALAEIGVRIVNMSIIAPLRKRTFYSLDELNEEILARINRINNRYSPKLKAVRRQLFNEAERFALTPLPIDRHVFTEWRVGIRVPKDYHVPWAGNFYSVPYVYVAHTVSISLSGGVIKIYLDSQCDPIAVHMAVDGERQAVTELAHMPDSHREYATNSSEALLAWAEHVGESVIEYFNNIRNNPRITPSKATQQMSKIKKLATTYGEARLLSACAYANQFKLQNFDSLKSVISKEIDIRNDMNVVKFVTQNVRHRNIRGPNTYRGNQ